MLITISYILRILLQRYIYALSATQKSKGNEKADYEG